MKNIFWAKRKICQENMFFNLMRSEGPKLRPEGQFFFSLANKKY